MKLKRAEWMRVLLDRAAHLGWQRKSWEFAKNDLVNEANSIGLNLSFLDMERLKNAFEQALRRF